MIDPNDVIRSEIRNKLFRAHAQMEAIDREVLVFLDGNAYATGEPQPNANRTQWVYPIKFARPIPVLWGVLSGELVHDLRSALDHAIYHLSVDYSKREVKGTGFPITTTPDGWMS